MKEDPDIHTTTLFENHVHQIEFNISVAGERIPCVLWRPGFVEPRTLIALGHGGAQHKLAHNIRDRALGYAARFGWASLAIDAPLHGDRTSPELAAQDRLRTEQRVRGVPNAPSLSASAKIQFLDTLAAQAIPEWQAALDVTLARMTRDVVSIGYWGVSQGTWIGIPLLAADHRFTCAVLGLAHLHPDHHALQRAAEHIVVPLRFVFQWDDPIRNREYGVALFTAFGSAEKSMHIYPGGHTDIPATEQESWDGFFQHHLEENTR